MVMLKDFVKMQTFLAVARERSFSKASSKLGISQPAVTQQIKYIEKYVDAKVVERKKNGIRLTPEGDELYKIVSKLEKAIKDFENEILKVINKQMTFRLGASFTIGSYVLPGECLNRMSELIGSDINLHIDVTDNIVQKIKDNKLDLALIESPVFDHDLIYREWIEDELVFCSNSPLPKILKTEELYNFGWICREEGSHSRKLITEVFKELGVSCKTFNVLTEVGNTTTALQSVKKAKKSFTNPTVTVISRHAIHEEVLSGELFEARMRGYTMKRKFYIVYAKDNKNNAFIDNVTNYILSGEC